MSRHIGISKHSSTIRIQIQGFPTIYKYYYNCLFHVHVNYKNRYTLLTLLGYQMLRCKLRCTKANGRITDNSHYHCCLCGRVLVRKVHLYCHLQAHSVGSMREIDEMLDAKDEAEEGPLEDSEMDEDDDNDTTLDTSQIAALDGSDQDNVVALSDGTQVTFLSISILCTLFPVLKRKT